MLKKNQDINLKIEGMTAEGNGVGHVDGLAVFVPGAAIEDELKVHIVKTKKTYAYGKILEITAKSPDRITPDCSVSERCGGCSYRHISYEAELAIKQQRVIDAFSRIAHIEINPSSIRGSELIDNYRNKAQFPISYNTNENKLDIGFYALSSHRIIPCKNCKLQPDVFEEILNIIENWVINNEISTYNELTKSGLLRHIYLRRGQETGEIMVCLVINGRKLPYSEELVKELKSKIQGLTTVVLNVNTNATNVIVGTECIPLFGDGYITDKICGLTFRISPLSFFQVNTKQAQVLYTIARDYAELCKDDVLLDLYCGTGTIGLTMANQVKKLYGIEIIDQAIEDARINARINNINNAEFFCGDATIAAEKAKQKGIIPSVVLVDPPRKGLTKDLIKTILEMAPKRVVYISCDPATLARDCAEFKYYGYKVNQVTPVDMFPRTAHVETVVLMSRKDK